MADRFAVTLRTLRFYEAKGLITPDRIGVHRVYAPEAQKRLSLILRAKRLGFSLRQIIQIVGDGDDGKVTALDDIRLSADQLHRQIAELESQHKIIETALAELRWRAYMMEELAAGRTPDEAEATYRVAG
jgi:DNA-binding transcriptional MerR regulator